MSASAPTLRVDAGIFDLDGVITDTASLHSKAWKRTFDRFLKERAAARGANFEPFRLPEDYLHYVDGKPRLEGVRSFLESRGIELPQGEPTDAPRRETLWGIGNEKQEIFNRLLKREGARVFDSTVSLLRVLRREGVRLAVVSSSRSCVPILRSAGILDLFDVVVDEISHGKLSLQGKPHPDAFLTALEMMGSRPERSFVVEDAVSGVEAGRNADFGLVLGVDRVGNRDPLMRAGAHLVVSDMEDIDLDRLRHWLENRQHIRPSALVYWEELRSRFSGKRAAVFLDYDGTLTPIVKRPELAKLSSETRTVLETLAMACPTAIVSGRGREDVARLVGLSNLVYAGSHGFDIAGPDGAAIRHEVGEHLLPEVARAREELSGALQPIPGVLIEDKRFSLAVHYRNVEEAQVGAIEQTVDRVLSAHPSLRKAHGKKVFELRPKLEWDKGKAVLWLLKALDLDDSDVAPLYVGDDLTDEDAFRALRGRGFGVVVTPNPRPTHADFSLYDTEEVREFLQRLSVTPKF